MDGIDYSSLKTKLQNPEFFRLPKGQQPRIHGHDLDGLFGYNIANIEKKLASKNPEYTHTLKSRSVSNESNQSCTWIGLHPQILQTPYSEIYEFLHLFQLEPPKKIVDLGGGYGRIGLVMSSLFPDCQFLGYEVVSKRAKEANRIFELLGLENCSMVETDIMQNEFVLPDADLYFIYDFSHPSDIKHVLQLLWIRWKLKNESAKDNRQFYIVARGQGVRSMITHKFPQFFRANGVIHQEHWSLYSSYRMLN